MDKQLMRKRINEVIKTDATVVELQDFMATHLPFKKLKYYTSGIEAIKGKELNEEDFFYEFIENTKDKHNFIVVQGDNGSGKSHFIRWIKNKIESEGAFPDDIVILLERSQNTLQATIKQLVNNEIIQGFLSEEEKIKLKNTGIELSEEKFTSMINYNFIIEAENEEEDEDCILKPSQRKGLVELLKDEIIQKNILFYNDGSIKRISNKLISSDDNSINEIDIKFTEKDFKLNSDILEELKESDANKKALRFAENLKEDKKGIRNNVAEYLNSKIDTVIQRTIKLNAADLNSILEKIRIKLKEINKNLILFIEDITAFTGVDKGVIESLIVEHREDNELCRLFSVIGVTTGYYQSHFPDNLKDRVTGRVFIDSNSLFDENNDVLELAARYINAINIEKDKLKKWVHYGAINSDLPLKESSKNWDIYKDTLNRKFALYPLTERAILNLYNAIQDKKTPRRFIKNILLPLLLHYTNDKNFPEGLSEFESELILPKFKNELLNRRIDSEINDLYENSRTKCLLRIWGDGTIDCFTNDYVKYIGSIDERIFDEFNIKKIEGNQVTSRPESIINKSVSKSQETLSYTIKNKLPIIKEVIQEKEKVESKQIIPQKVKEMNSIEKDLNDWFFNNGNLKMHAKVREYVLSFLKEGISWDIEEVSMYLVNETLNLYNLKIRNQQLGDEKGDNILWIEKTEEDYYFLLSLMKYIIIGSKTWNYENSQDDILIVIKWLENNKKRIIEYVLNGNDNYYDMYEYAMYAEMYSTAINKNFFRKDNSEIKINEMSTKGLFNAIIKKLEVKEETKLNLILGRFAKIYFDKRSLININHELIINYYNCPLGKGKGIFLDAYEILKVIDKISKFNFNINEFSDKKFKNDKEFWKRPYELLKKVYCLNLTKALSENLSILKNKDKDYLESFNEIGSINTFFETLELNNIIYDGSVKDDFNKLFDDTIKYNKYIENKKCIKESNNIDLIDKIYLLKSSIPKEIIEYNEILEKVENIIIKQEEKYSVNITSNITTSEDINRIFNECILKIEKMERNTKEVKEALKC